MRSWKIFTDLWSLMMMIGTFVFCRLRRSLVFAWAALNPPLQVNTPKATRFNDEDTKLRCSCVAVEPADFDDDGSWDVNYSDLPPDQTFHPDYDIVRLMNEKYSTRVELMKTNFKMSKMEKEQKIMSKGMQDMGKRISALEETLNQEKNHRKDFHAVVRGEFRRRDDFSVKQLSVLRDTNVLMQRRMQTLKVSNATLKIRTNTTFQNLYEKLEGLIEIVASSRRFDIQVMRKFNEMIVYLQRAVGFLVNDMKSLMLNMKNRSEEIVGLKSELAEVKRSYRNKESKNDLFNRLRTADIKKFKIHAKNDFKRLKTRLMNEYIRSKYVDSDKSNKQASTLFALPATPAPLAAPVPLVAPVTPAVPALQATPVPVSLAAPTNLAPPAPLLQTASEISSHLPLKASRKTDLKEGPSFSIEMFKNTKLRKAGDEPKKIYRLPVNIPLTKSDDKD